jgi:hypothetical protein
MARMTWVMKLRSAWLACLKPESRFAIMRRPFVLRVPCGAAGFWEKPHRKKKRPEEGRWHESIGSG